MKSSSTPSRLQELGNGSAADHPGDAVDRSIGHVVGLWRYPVKSMAPETLDAVDVSWHGFAGDRRWAFVRDGVVSSGFPWLTLRQRAELGHFRPLLTEPGRPDKSPTRVVTPGGREFDITDPDLATEVSAGTGQLARLIRQDRGTFDAFPLSLITRQTLIALGEKVGLPLDVRRFRPNLLVDCPDEPPFAEDRWVGKTLRIGDFSMRVDKRDGRCVVITIDPESSERQPEILRTVAQDRDGCLGVYGSVVEPGVVHLGDAVGLDT